VKFLKYEESVAESGLHKKSTDRTVKKSNCGVIHENPYTEKNFLPQYIGTDSLWSTVIN
jgi:hypothetical protein